MKSSAPETPAVVLSTKGVSLADKLRLSELPLATTAGGKAFTFEALHPSSNEYPMTRVPGGNKRSVSVRCDMVEQLEIQDDGTRVEVIVSPNVMVPATMNTVPPVGSTNPVRAGNFYNAAFGGSFKTNPTAADSTAFMTSFLKNVESYRITAQSVTVEVIASELLNQGSITAYQCEVPPLTANATDTASSSAKIFTDFNMYYVPPPPSEGMLGTAAYTSKARDGCYMPLRLNSFKWKDVRDRTTFVQADQGMYEKVTADIATVPCTAPLQFPYWEDRSNTTSWTVGPKLCGSNFGVVQLANLLKGASVRVRVRQVVEVYSRPGTYYAPLLQPALPPDETALRMYFEISARMMDAYPASYNDLNKLKTIIGGLAKKILPYVDPALDFLANSSIPVIGTGAQIAKTAIGLGRQVAGAVKSAKAAKASAKTGKK